MTSLAAFYLYNKPSPLGGIIGLSGASALSQPPANMEVFRNTPIFLYHGDEDHYFSVANTSLTYQLMKDNCSENMTMEIQEGLGHNINAKELVALRQWLHDRMKSR